VQITELRPVPEPVVFGYLRLGRSAPAREAALRDALTGYCERHELDLLRVFADHGGSDSASTFTRLIDAVASTSGYAVVVPTRLHLGRNSLAVTRHTAITQVKARLLIIRSHRAPLEINADEPW
jgi:hypothetical protein